MKASPSHGRLGTMPCRVKCLSGTTIEVRSLFFNVPARKKFLKSPAKDASDIVKVLLQTALANPKVAFELILNHNREFSWQASSIEDRIKDALGSEFFSELIAISFEKDGVSIHGFIAKPTYSRPTRSQQHLFVNNRPVQSLALSHAVKEAYGSSLDPARHPAFVLFIDVATTALDVNVHPQKKEVRFSFEDELKQLLIQAVSSTLFSRNATAAIAVEPMGDLMRSFTSGPFTNTPKEFSHNPIYEARRAPNPSSYPDSTREPPAQFTQMFLPETAHAAIVHAVVDDFIIADITWPDRYDLPDDLLQEGLYIISTKRALSRLAFDGASQEKNGEKAASQTLLVPVFLELSTNEAVQLRAMIADLERTGIVIVDFGRSSFLVQAIPGFLDASSIPDIIHSLLEDEGAICDLASTLAKACRATKNQKTLSKEAASHVVKKLLECVNPFQCPVGDKIVSKLSINELEKKFR